MLRWLAAGSVLCVLILGSVSDAAAKAIAWHSDLTRAAHSAKQTDKPLLIKVSATWCGPCKRMLRDTFENEQIAEHVRQCFIPVALDSDQHATLIKRMGVSAYPTTLVVSQDLQVLKRISGYRTPTQLSDDLAGLCNKVHPPRASLAAQPATERGAPPFADWCPVSPIVDGAFAKGQEILLATYRGHHLYFRTARHRQLFLENPQRFWPVADGRCVVSWLDERVSRHGQMRFGFEYQGRIWFFASEEHRARFAAAPDLYYRQLIRSATQPPARNS